MTGLDQRVLEEAVRRLREGLHPAKIFLYGSYAYGQPDEDSDVDLLVVMETLEGPAYEVEAEAYRLLSGLKFPAEIRVVGEEAFRDRAGWLATVEREVQERGVELYAAA